MRYSVRTHPEADLELDDYFAYLARETLWQVGQFADHLDVAVGRLRDQPTLCHFVWNDFRRFNMKKYPISIIYRVEPESKSIYVVAFMHQRRHPDYWKSRIDEATE